MMNPQTNYQPVLNQRDLLATIGKLSQAPEFALDLEPPA